MRIKERVTFKYLFNYEKTMAKKKRDKARIFLSVFLIIGMLISLVLIYEHFVEGASEFCSFGANLDCGIVNKSPYANLDGLSYLLTIDFGWNLPLIDISGINFFFDFITANAFLGFLTLLLVLGLNTRYKSRNFLFIKKEASVNWIRGILIFGIVYGFYLFLVQHFILQTYCVLCLGLDVMMVASLIASFMIKK